MYDSIESLTTGMSRGDERAVEQFYETYFDDLFRWARRSGGRDEAMCLDIVQDAVLKILRCIRPLPDAPRFRAWLRLVVQSQTLDRLRREQRTLSRESRHDRNGTTNAGDVPDGAAQMRWLRSQIEQLDPGLSRMIELRYERGWTLRRIAAAFGGTTGQIDGRLRRAVQRLRGLAREQWDNP
ncbi:MAG TPA: sigma-70 family RNA polymerase sigma factor [Pirellulaceae bacterium]